MPTLLERQDERVDDVQSTLQLAKFKKEKKRAGSKARKDSKKRVDRKRRVGNGYKKQKSRARDKRNDATGLLDDDSQRVRDYHFRRGFHKSNRLDLVDERDSYKKDWYHTDKRSVDSYKKKKK